MVNVGVIGVGHMGWLHARNLVGLKGARLAAVLDTEAPRALRAASEFGARAVSTLEELAACCDAAVVAVPTTAHHEVAADCLRRGLHVFIEKPIARRTEEASALIGAARAARRVLGVGHVERFNPVFVAMAGAVGHPLFIEGHRLAPFVPRSIDVDVVLDLMIHDLDLVLSVLPQDAERVDAAGVPVITGREDIANVRIAFPGGEVANLTASRVSRERMRRIRFFSARTYVSLDLLNRTGEIVRLAADPREWIARGEVPPVSALLERRVAGPFPQTNPLADELEDFVRAVREEGTTRVSGEDGRRALALALRTKASVEEHLGLFRELGAGRA